MKIFIVTYGSRGDVQPYVALGKGLKAAGHQVTLATSVRFRQLVIDNGLAYGYMSDDLLAIVDTDQGKDLLENTTTLFDVLRQSVKLKQQLVPLQKALLAESWTAAQKALPDLIVFHPKGYGGLHFAEKLKIPAVLALPFPMLVPSGERPHIGFPDLPLGRGYNRDSYRMVAQLMSLSAKSPVNAWRKSVGLPQVRRFDLLRRDNGRPVPVLNGFSPVVVPPAPDWPKTVITTGYWFLDNKEPWTPAEDLAAFLRAGPPPVYIGFGSMTGHSPGDLATLVIRALDLAGARGILATGWGGLAPGALPDTIIPIDQAPHDQLFPRMAAIVHHGGAGTTAAALRSGRPSVIVPFFGDQPFWGDCIRRLGAGPAPIPRKKLTAENLARTLGRALNSTTIKTAVKTIGQTLRSEDGISRAVRAIETIAEKGAS